VSEVLVAVMFMETISDAGSCSLNPTFKMRMAELGNSMAVLQPPSTHGDIANGLWTVELWPKEQCAVLEQGSAQSTHSEGRLVTKDEQYLALQVCELQTRLKD
jgi:hypothetical protein